MNAQHALEPGTVVAGRFVVLETAGRGGMGTVHAAYDPKLDRKVALKVLRDEADEELSNDQRARLLREARVMARISHPNVLAVHDVGTHEGRDFVAMELVSGTTVRQWAQERRRAWREILHVMLEAGAGLRAAHEAGLVHRDFKPDNVLIDDKGRVRVMDFGLARLLSVEESSGEQTLTGAGAPVGTPAYMSPEQTEGRPADEKSDQFNFCVSLFELLTGGLPFGAGPPGQVRFGSRSGRVPFWLRRILSKGMSLSAAERYASMDGLLSALSDGMRRQAGSRLGMARLVGVLSWLAFTWLDYARGDPDVGSQLFGLHIYSVIAVLILLGQRLDRRFRSYSHFAVPLLDLPFVTIERVTVVKQHMLSGNPEMAWYSAGFFVAILLVVLTFSIVTLDPVVVALTTCLVLPAELSVSLWVRPDYWVGAAYHLMPLAMVGTMGFVAARRVQSLLRGLAPTAPRRVVSGMLEDPWVVTRDPAVTRFESNRRQGR